MIVPRTKLLGFTLVAVTPFATLLGAEAAGPGDSASAAVAAVCLAAALIAIVLDAVSALYRLEGVRVEMPDVVRLSKAREGVIPLRIASGHRRAARLRLGLALPPELEAPYEALDTTLPADAQHATVWWRCTPTRRGRYFLRNVYLEAPSLLGLWAMRGVSPGRAEVRVYPNLERDRRHLAALFLNRGPFGVHTHRQVGKGREFEQLREYIPGDSYEDIHWKATAKRSRPVTKVFQIERTQEVYVLVDASRLSARVPENVAHGNGSSLTQLERFITAALVLGLTAEQQGDHFGVAVFSDRIEQFVRAGSGKAHYSNCRDALYTLEPRIVNPDFDELCTFVRLRMRRRALLVILTNLDDPVLAQSFTRNVDLIRRQHLVLVNMITPQGVRPLFIDDRVGSLDDLYRNLAGHIRWHELRELERVLHHRGVSFALLDNERMAAQLVTQYIDVKQRQLL